MTPRQSFDTLMCGLFASLLLPRAATAAPRFERVHDEPCRALALDQEPYWAALGREHATVSDKRGVHHEALPDALRVPGAELGIFFGRDYRIRIAGTAPGAKGDEVRYFRSLQSGLRPALDELGPLGKAGEPALFALLGTPDPEIVCRQGLTCLIKSVKGWKKASAPSGLERVGLSVGGGWALAGSGLFQLEKDWVAVPGRPWKKASDAFVRGDHACVVEHDAGRLHHFDGTTWRSAPSPIAGPRSLWGDAASLWLAGDGGVATATASGLQAVAGSPQKAMQILGRSSQDVWLCTEQGVFRSR